MKLNINRIIKIKGYCCPYSGPCSFDYGCAECFKKHTEAHLKIIVRDRRLGYPCEEAKNIVPGIASYCGRDGGSSCYDCQRKVVKWLESDFKNLFNDLEVKRNDK